MSEQIEFDLFPYPVQSKTMSLGASAPSEVLADIGKSLSSVSPVIDSTVIKAENIAQGATILGVAGSHTGGAMYKHTVSVSLINAGQAGTGSFTFSFNHSSNTQITTVPSLINYGFYWNEDIPVYGTSVSRGSVNVILRKIHPQYNYGSQSSCYIACTASVPEQGFVDFEASIHNSTTSVTDTVEQI